MSEKSDTTVRTFSLFHPSPSRPEKGSDLLLLCCQFFFFSRALRSVRFSFLWWGSSLPDTFTFQFPQSASPPPLMPFCPRRPAMLLFFFLLFPFCKPGVAVFLFFFPIRRGLSPGALSLWFRFGLDDTKPVLLLAGDPPEAFLLPDSAF